MPRGASAICNVCIWVFVAQHFNPCWNCFDLFFEYTFIDDQHRMYITGSIRTELWSFMKFLKSFYTYKSNAYCEIPNNLNKLRYMLKFSMKLKFNFRVSFQKSNISFIESRKILSFVLCRIVSCLKNAS